MAIEHEQSSSKAEPLRNQGSLQPAGSEQESESLTSIKVQQATQHQTEDPCKCKTNEWNKDENAALIKRSKENDKKLRSSAKES